MVAFVLMLGILISPDRSDAASEIPKLEIQLADGGTLTKIDNKKQNDVVGSDGYFRYDSIKLTDPSNSSNNVTLSTSNWGSGIRGRGNATFSGSLPKKPYQLKFDNKVSVLGMNSSKKWVLLANLSDPTFMRNTLSMEMAQDMGRWAPTMKPVN